MTRTRRRFLRRLHRYERQQAAYPQPDAPEVDDDRARLAVALDRAAYGKPGPDGMLSPETVADVLAILGEPEGADGTLAAGAAPPR